MTDAPLRRRLAAEAVGTFALVFAGTTAIVVNDATAALSHVGVSLVFGLVVFALIAAVGDVSGAHLNPAVTLGFWRAGRFPGRTVLPYLIAQTIGAVAASGVVRLLFPDAARLGGTVPAGAWQQAWVLELLLTGGLMFVVLGVCSGAKEKGVTAGLAIGATVALMALLAGPVSGASMNPARSLAPALVSGQLAAVWVYLTAPPLGAVLAVPVCRCIRGVECCPIVGGGAR